MASEWRTKNLRDAGIQLIDCDHRTPSAIEGGYPYIAIPQLKDGRIELGDVRRISKADYEDWTRKLKPREHDVVVVRRCSSGDSAVVPRGLECAIGQNLVVLRSDGTHISPGFLRWIVRSAEWWEQVRKFMNVGAVFNSLKCKDIPNFEVVVPPLDAQREITILLTGLDDRIVLLRQTSATLQAIAKALFKSWFVDFDPVRAKAEGRDPDGVPADVAELLPREFEDSELGATPKGWIVASLDSIAEFLNGLAMQKFPVENEAEWLPVIKIAQLRKGDTEGADRASLRVPSEYVIQDGDVLFSWSGSLEVEIWCGGVGGLNQHLFKVTSKQFPKWFYYLWTKVHLPSFRETAAHKATTMGHIQRCHLAEAKVVIPSEKLMRALSEIFAPLIQRAWECRLEARTLATLRDTLLPRLMSGKLRIPSAVSELESTS